VPFGLKGILLTWGATFSNITKPCNNMHYKKVSTLEKALLFVAVYSRHTRWVRFPTYPQDCSLTYYEFCKTGVRLSQLHKSKTVYVVDGVASRYTNSRTLGFGFDCNTQVLLRIVPTITPKLYNF
jgi:hypothetical protein